MRQNTKKTDDLIAAGLIRALSLVSVVLIFFIIIFVFQKAFPVFMASGLGLFTETGFDTQISEAFISTADNPMLTFGLAGLMIGTIVTTLFSVTFAALIGLGMAITITEFIPEKLSVVFQGVIHLLASIPSVVFGLIGIITVVPLVENLFITVDLQIEYLEFFQITGRNMLSAVLILTFMIVPTIVSLCINALKEVPENYKEIGYSFGMSHFRVIRKIQIPSAFHGIVNAVILGAGRGIGEAIAVSMVCGGLGIMPDFSRGLAALLAPVLPLAPAIINKSEAMGSMPVESALFACGALLLILETILSVSATLIKNRQSRGNQA